MADFPFTLRLCNSAAKGGLSGYWEIYASRPPLSSLDAIEWLLPSRFLDTILPMIHATTILSVRHGGRVVMASDGQVTLGDAIVKHGARKIRRLYNDKVLAGFAGSAADSFALFSRFEAKLDQYRGNLERSAVELAKDWRTDRGAAAPRGDARRGRRAVHVSAVGHRRPHRAGRRHSRDRVGWQLRHGRRPGAGPAHRRSTPASSRKSRWGSRPRSASTRTPT